MKKIGRVCGESELKQYHDQVKGEVRGKKMERSAVNSDKGSKADSSKDNASRTRSVGENDRKMELDPLRGLVQRAQCRGCGSSIESVAQRMVSMPASQRRAGGALPAEEQREQIRAGDGGAG